MKNLIVVPAKGESKRIPRKNWRRIGGNTLFELALFRARKSDLGDIVFVSDDEEMTIDVQRGGYLHQDVDFNLIMPTYLNEKRALDTCLWVVELLRDIHKKSYDNIVVTLPTSPLATADQMREAYTLFLENNRKPLGSFTAIRGRPFLWKGGYEGNPGDGPKRVYRMPRIVVYVDNGAFFVSKVNDFLRRREWFPVSVVPYFMDEVTGVDVDTEEDYLKAKVFYEGRDGLHSP